MCVDKISHGEAAPQVCVNPADSLCVRSAGTQRCNPIDLCTAHDASYSCYVLFDFHKHVIYIQEGVYYASHLCASVNFFFIKRKPMFTEVTVLFIQL